MAEGSLSVEMSRSAELADPIEEYYSTASVVRNARAPVANQLHRNRHRACRASQEVRVGVPDIHRRVVAALV